MKVIFFAQSRQIAGCADFTLTAQDPLTAPEFWARLIGIFPGLATLEKGARLARNETYLQAGDLLQPGDEIAVIPPVSGG